MEKGWRKKENKSFHQAGFYMLSQLSCSSFGQEKKKKKRQLKHKAVWIVENLTQIKCLANPTKWTGDKSDN